VGFDEVSRGSVILCHNLRLPKILGLDGISPLSKDDCDWRHDWLRKEERT
jgi:hypothetical protein